MTFDKIMQNENFTPNSEQLPVIEATRNTVVSAGAGAGKTAVLSWRFLRLVMEQGVKPEEILTLTFTKKAASEMRERIYKRLMMAKDSLPADTLDSFSNATIATLDSFCAQVVRSDSTSYGLPRDTTVISEEDLEDLAQRLSSRFLADSSNLEETRAIASLIMPNQLMDGFFSLIAKSVSIVGDYDAERISRSFYDTVCKRFRERQKAIVPLLDHLGELELSAVFTETYNLIRKRFESNQITDYDDFNLRQTRDPEVKAIVGELRPLLCKGSGYAALQSIAMSEFHVSPMQMAVQKFASMLNYEKRRLGMLTFKDVSDLAVDILKTNTELRGVYKNRFRYIMIDEFQDNNTSQRDLLFLLSEKRSLEGQSGVVPEVADLEPDKLFFVGDEKQSIYRFRGADVSVFRHLQTEIGENGSSLTLSTNYRSQGRLIDHFNSVFRNVLSDEGRDFEARFSPIRAGRRQDDTRGRIIFSVYQSNQIEDDELDGGSLEAEAVADYCDKALNTDEFLVDGKRPRPEEIAILFRATTNQMNIEKALKRRGIPYQLSETRSLMLDAVANDFYSFLNCLLYPNDRRGYIALLKSPFCGLCEESIENVMSEDIKPVLPIDAGRYRAFLELFGRVKAVAFRLTIAELLEMLYIEGGYRAFLESELDRSVFEEHYEYLSSYAIQYDDQGKSLTDFARFLRDKMGTSDKLPDAEVLCRQKSGVQLMTVHKSKGLEFKVVIFSGIGSRPRGDESRYVFEYNGDLVSTESKGILKILEQDRSEKEDAELKRLMYVALTRAKDHLILVGGFRFTKEGEVSSAKVFKWYCDAIGADLHSCTCNDEGVTIEDVTSLALYRAHHDDDNTDYSWADGVFPQFRQKASRVAVTSLGHSVEFAETGQSLPVFKADSIVGPMELQAKFGTLCHYVLECLMRDGSYDGVTCDICDSEHDNELLLEQAKAFADGFVSSSFYRDHVQNRKTHEELRFYTSDSAGSDVAVEGVIDLLVMGEDYNLVVDYKTDVFKNPEVHKAQVLTYIKVAEDLFKKRCLGTLFYLRDGSTSVLWDREGREL